MKTILTMLLGVLAASAVAQAADSNPSTRTEIPRITANKLTLAGPAKRAQIVSRRFTFNGIAVQVIKTKNPLQLLNPIAPPQYGAGVENVVREPVTRRITGLKLLSISF